MSILLGKKIGEGGCSEVFEYEEGNKIIKLAKDITFHEPMRREYDNNLIAWNNELPVAKPYEFVEISGRPGIVFERIYGVTIMERLLIEALSHYNGTAPASEKNGNNIRTIARLLHKIHNKTEVTLPSNQRDLLRYSINSTEYLSISEKESVISILDTLPIKQKLCHGDPNPANFMINDDGNAVIIDWMNASIGNPEADLAEFIIMIRFTILPSNIPSSVSNIFNEIREKIIEIFMDEYTKLSGITYEEVFPWLIPVAARKLSADAISDDEKKLLISEIRRHLSS